MTQDKAGGKRYLLGGEEDKGDGDTAQTRQLEMRQDTLFTALFQSTQDICAFFFIGLCIIRELYVSLQF